MIVDRESYHAAQEKPVECCLSPDQELCQLPGLCWQFIQALEPGIDFLHPYKNALDEMTLLSAWMPKRIMSHIMPKTFLVDVNKLRKMPLKIKRGIGRQRHGGPNNTNIVEHRKRLFAWLDRDLKNRITPKRPGYANHKSLDLLSHLKARPMNIKELAEMTGYSIGVVDLRLRRLQIQGYVYMGERSTRSLRFDWFITDEGKVYLKSNQRKLNAQKSL
jgi:hypothetical protein